MLRIIEDADKRHWIMNSGNSQSTYQLLAPHAYAVLGTVQLKNGPKLIKLRDPTTDEPYSGPFRDSDPRWKPEWKA